MKREGNVKKVEYVKEEGYMMKEGYVKKEVGPSTSGGTHAVLSTEHLSRLVTIYLIWMPFFETTDRTTQT